ncbi:hypothetical protein KKH43_01260 [Patescibacteria group bacterium]|nr:hypothetical protein [Patescibacteria group bacterium]
MKYTCLFSEIGKKDVARAGGKGASLGEMTKKGFPVPPGFVVVSFAFESFLKVTDLHVEISALLDTVNIHEIHTVENAASKIQNLILQAYMPHEIEEHILCSFKKLNTPYVAVRSSATAEDSLEAAWAGQLESYLNTTEKTLLLHVQKCWASLFTPRAIFYRLEKNLIKNPISVAVVVQKMIQSDASGVAFSVHPVTEDKNQMIVEASYGLGEAVVSGSVTPDSYVVQKKPLALYDINVCVQTKGLYRGKEGNEWKKIPQKKGERQVLLDKEILELARIIMTQEEHCGFPVDVEWALEKGKFYVLQSRPITTLKNKKLAS